MAELYKELLSQVKANNKRLYESVGNPAPNTITVVNSAETAVGFTSRGRQSQIETGKKEEA